MSALPRALPRSESKAKLLKHLHMSNQVYTSLAKEADVVYKELVGDRRNLKPSQWNAEPPYDWNDICERSREDAINKLAVGDNSTTKSYWQRGSTPLADGNPWLPVWFLYKVFRHRDGRARFSKSNSSPAQNTSHPGTNGTPDCRNGHGDMQLTRLTAYATNLDTSSLTPVNRGTSTAIQKPAYVASGNKSSTRSFYDPVREEYIER